MGDVDFDGFMTRFADVMFENSITDFMGDVNVMGDVDFDGVSTRFRGADVMFENSITDFMGDVNMGDVFDGGTTRFRGGDVMFQNSMTDFMGDVNVMGDVDFDGFMTRFRVMFSITDFMGDVNVMGDVDFDGIRVEFRSPEMGLNDNQLRLRGASDPNHYLTYLGVLLMDRSLMVMQR